VALLALAGLLSACTGSSAGQPGTGPTSDEAATALRAAVSATSAASTVRLATRSEMTVAGTTYPATTTSGASTLDGTRSVSTGRVPDGRMGSTVAYELRVVVDDGRVWFSFPAVARQGISSWGSSSVADARSGYDLTLPAVWRLPDWLSALQSATDVADAGAGTVGAAPARRYTAVLPRGEDTLSDSLGGWRGGAANARDDALRLEVWVGQDGRLARVRQSWDASTAIGSDLTETVTVDLTDYGVGVRPEPPTGELSGLTPGQMFGTIPYA
jgi:hypothetical protein